MSSTPYGSDPTGSYVPPGGNAPTGPLPSGMAVASLILGVLGILSAFFLIGGLLGLIALILGLVALGKIKRGLAGGRGMAIAGIVTGVIALLLSIVVVVSVGAFFAENKDEFSNLAECVEAAGDDQAAVQACQEDFARSINP